MLKRVDIDKNLIPKEPPRLRRTLWWIFIVTFVIYLIPSPVGPGHFLLIKSMAFSWNDQARVATVESLAEQGTMAVDYTKWGWFSGDTVFLREHWYSTKPPTLSALGAAIYVAYRGMIKGVTGHEITYINNEDIIYPMLVLTTNVFTFALLLVYFFRSLHLVDLTNRARWWLFWALAVGTLYPAYTSVFNNHTVAGALIFIGFYYVIKYRLGGAVRWWEAMFAGLMVGFAGVNDYTGALPFLLFIYFILAITDLGFVSIPTPAKNEKGAIAVWALASIAMLAMLRFRLGTTTTAVLLVAPFVCGFALSIYLWIKKRPMTILCLVGITLPVIAHLFLNSKITGNWLPTYIQSDVYIATPPGYFGEVLTPEQSSMNNLLYWKYIGAGLFGIRGIFLYTPALLMGLVSSVAIFFTRGHRFRLEALATILAVLAGWGYVLFVASTNFGGTSYGFRYALVATPILIFFCHRYFQDWDNRITQAIFRNAVAWGAIVGLIAIPYPWGISGELPSTLNSIVCNMEYITLNVLRFLS